MKAFGLFTIALMASAQITAQTWFELGLKGGPATTFLINGNIMDDAQYNHKVVPTYFAGFKVGVNFGEEHGVAFDLSTTAIRQKYNNEYDLSLFDERFIKGQTIDIGVLYHRTKASGYFEIGPQISLLQSASVQDDNGAAYSIINDINSNYFGATMGFGGYITGNETLSLMVGLRFSYGFKIFPENYDGAPLIAQLNYDTPRATDVATVMLCFELNYSLGYLVRSSCGRRSSFISF